MAMHDMQTYLALMADFAVVPRLCHAVLRSQPTLLQGQEGRRSDYH